MCPCFLRRQRLARRDLIRGVTKQLRGMYVPGGSSVCDGLDRTGMEVYVTPAISSHNTALLCQLLMSSAHHNWPDNRTGPVSFIAPVVALGSVDDIAGSGNFTMSGNSGSTPTVNANSGVCRLKFAIPL